jgi:hypothetical protein
MNFCACGCGKKTKTIYCQGHNSRVEHPMWKGGVTFWGGYKFIKTYNHPFAPKNKYIMEHRLVMEKKIERYLNPKEVVHHINGDTLDNRIENLQLFSSCGQHTKIGHPEICIKGGLATRGKRPKNYNRGIKECPVCGKSFETTFGTSGKTFCTPNCYWRSKSRII